MDDGRWMMLMGFLLPHQTPVPEIDFREAVCPLLSHAQAVCVLVSLSAVHVHVLYVCNGRAKKPIVQSVVAISFFPVVE
jgi:hypothetical protein